MFIDIGYYHPVRHSTALFPTMVGDRLFGERKRIGILSHKFANFNILPTVHDSKRCVGGAIVKNKIASDETIVMAKEKREHVGVIPA